MTVSATEAARVTSDSSVSVDEGGLSLGGGSRGWRASALPVESPKIREGERAGAYFPGGHQEEARKGTDDRSHVTAPNFRHKGEMIKGTVVVAGGRENFPVILPLIFKRGVAVRSPTS